MMNIARRRIAIGAIAAAACPIIFSGRAHNEPPKPSTPPVNPLDCQIPACSDKMSMFKKAVHGVNAGPKKQEKVDGAGKSGQVNVTVAAVVVESVLGCPLDRNELGKSSWDLLHTMAANYPEEPTEKQKQQMTAFVEALAAFYPCIHCATDFQESIKISPPRVGSRAELSLWMCEQHNEVNEKLGKPSFPCSLPALDDRWRVSRRSECAVLSREEQENALIEAFIEDAGAEQTKKL